MKGVRHSPSGTTPRMYCLRLFILLAISDCLAVPTRRLDWAINGPSGVSYLICGDDYYKFNRYRQEVGSGKASDLFPGLPSGIQAATWWPGPDKYYFFKDGKYYCADQFGGSVSGPFEGSSLGDIFTRTIDAAVTISGKTYFYQNSHLYEFEGDKLNRDIDAGLYELPGKMDAAISVKNVMFFFEGPTRWSARPLSVGIRVASTPVSMTFYFKSIVIG